MAGRVAAPGVAARGMAALRVAARDGAGRGAAASGVAARPSSLSRRGGGDRLGGWTGVVLGLLATVLAYGGSEAVKLVVDEERPCRVIDGLGLAAVCPPAGDWSFPSNQATCAGALAMALLLIRPRLGLLTVPVAGLVALARVAEGVHYPHDVLAGLIWGAVVSAVLLPLFAPLARRLPAAGLHIGSDRPNVDNSGQRGG
ncbi:MAG: phosphatase PAP2 family protein [Streptosporangiales bacterium]|nr:phosphatase PAP2 family protein [Streptosporangiales bacterium]